MAMPTEALLCAVCAARDGSVSLLLEILRLPTCVHDTSEIDIWQGLHCGMSITLAGKGATQSGDCVEQAKLQQHK